MKKSESIATIGGALAKAQLAMTTAKKDSANPFFGSRYADLASVWDACRDVLGQNGIAVCQMPETAAEGCGICMTTLLMHASGEWLSFELTLTPVKSDPQGFGSLITYMRRYTLAAAVGVAPEDDDGNAASGKTAATTANAKPLPPPKNTSGPATQAAAKPEAMVKGASGPPKAADPLDPDAPIDLGWQRLLHREFREAMQPGLASQADTWLRSWLKSEGYVGADGEGTTKTIPSLLFDEVRSRAIRYAAGLR